MPSVGLARESSAVAAKELAYDYQVERLEEYGCSWVYGDRISGTRDDRKGLELALDKIRSGEADELVVTHLTRLGRSVLTINRVVKLLKQHGARLTVLGGAIDTSTPEGRAFLQSQAVWGEYEAELGAERQRIGWENTQRKGRPRAPVFGYLIREGNYVPDREDRGGWSNWEVGLAIIAKFEELRSLNSLAIWAHSEYRHLKNGPRQQRPPFTPRGLKVWMLNPVLLGHIRFTSGITHFDRHEAMIGPEQSTEILRIVERRTMTGLRTQERRYAYSGLVYCGECGKRCEKLSTNQRSTSQRKKNPLPREEEPMYIYYRCKMSRIKECSNSVRVRAEAIDDAVMKAIAQQSQAIAEWLLREDQVNPAPQNPKVLELQNRIDRLQAVVEIDPRIRETINDLEREIANLLSVPAELSLDKIRDAGAMMDSFSDPNFWAEFNGKEKHDRLKHVIRRISVLDRQIVAVEFLPAFCVPSSGDENLMLPEQ